MKKFSVQKIIFDLNCFVVAILRFLLFFASSLIPHIKSFDNQSTENWSEKLMYYKELHKNEKNLQNLCTKQLFIEPQTWFTNKLNEIKGKLNCPKCDSKLGEI